MVIETERLLLKEYNMNDLDDFFNLKSRKEVWEHSTFIPLTNKKEAAELLKSEIQKKMNSEAGFMGMYIKNTNELIGEAGILVYNKEAKRCEIGYNLLPKYWNKGYATEITKALLIHCYETLHAERVQAIVIENNIKSRNVLEKSGFILEGILRNFNKYEGGYRNVCFYGMISSDYFRK